MAGRAVATTVASSICMKSAQPTMKGIIRARAARPGSRAERDGRLRRCLRAWREGRWVPEDCNAGGGPGCSKLRDQKPAEIGVMATNYESEITLFLKDYKKSHPGTEERQREGRARLWDKPQDQELQEGFRAARVPQKPYVYQAD